MRMNQKPVTKFTHAGAVASHTNPIEELRRSILACLLWERNFYESGIDHAERVKQLVPKCKPFEVAELAVEARDKYRLRHAPLLLIRELARHGKFPIADALCSVIQRADELAEFLALYWSDGKQPLSKQVKKGLACAFCKFDEYQLAKYNRDSIVKLRDVLFMVHAKPKDEKQAEVWKRLANKTLQTPDTWEVALSGGEDKKTSFERLLKENKLGYMALLRNLRNMHQSEVDTDLIFDRLQSGAEKSKALPFRYVAAARAVPSWEPQLDKAMQSAMAGMSRLKGRTVLLVDVSGSMDSQLSSKSDLSRIDAASALAVYLGGICDDIRIFTFSNDLAEVPPRNGMALIDAIDQSQPHHGTWLGKAVETVNSITKPDRLMVITDEQSHDRVGPPAGRGYMINVASNRNGVGYGDWVHVHGFSESIIQYIAELESVSD